MEQPVELHGNRSISYESVLKRLPAPSWEQCERFARYLSQAHSWYKIPIGRERRFVVFLEPAAGCTMEWQNGRPLRPQEITQGSGMMTQQYRALFGFWNYDWISEGGEVRLDDPLNRWLLDGSRIRLPDEWIQASATSLDGFLHPYSPIGYVRGWERYMAENGSPLNSASETINAYLLSRIAVRPHRLKEVLEATIPAHFRDTLRPSSDSIGDFHSNFYWPDARWISRLTQLRVPREYWSPLCKYFELEVRAEVKIEWPGLPSDFPLALAEERIAQLIRLTDAMSAFLRKLKQTVAAGTGTTTRT